MNILEAIRKHSPNTVIHIPGSGEEYGDILESSLPINPSTPLNPVNPYAAQRLHRTSLAKSILIVSEPVSSVLKL